MDSTLFDYKNSFIDPQRDTSKNTIKSLRPTSAQSSKLMYNNMSSNSGDGQTGYSPAGGVMRNRPATATNKNDLMSGETTNKNIPTSIIEELEPEEEGRLVERANQSEPLQLLDVQKLMPRVITVEKEKLYEDTLHLKQILNALKEENLKLKTRNLNLERDNARLAKSIEKAGVPEYGKPVEGALVVALKKQVKELREDIKVKQEELDANKKNMKFTKFKELDIEVKAFADENVRLKRMCEEIMRAKPQIKVEDYTALEEKCYTQASYIETLQRDLERLTNEIRFLEQEIFQLQDVRQKEVKAAQKNQTEVSRLKKQLRDKTAKAAAETKLLEKIKDQGDTKRQLELKEQQITQKDKHIEDLNNKLNNIKKNNTRDSSANDEVQRLREQYAELEAKYKAVTTSMSSSPEKKERPASSKPQKAEPKSQQPTHQTVQHTHQSADTHQEPRAVTLEDIENLADDLGFKLRVRHIPLKEVLGIFDQYGPKISIGDMKAILEQDPFVIKDENNALLLARCLIELDEEDDDGPFDINKAQEVKYIKEGFRDLVGDYTLYNEQEEVAMAQELSDIVSKYGQSLQAQFSMMPEAKSGYLGYDKIAEAFRDLEIALDEKAFEFLLVNLYEYTGNLRKLDYMKMFELFETEESKRLKKIIEMYQNDKDEEDYSSDSDKNIPVKAQSQNARARPQSSKGRSKPETQAPIKKQVEEEDEEDEYEQEQNELNKQEEEDYEDEAYESDN